MRTMLKVALLFLCIALPAAAQRRTSEITAGSGHYSLLGGDTVGNDVNVVSSEVGWPSISFGITHGVSRTADVGLRFDLLFGIDGDTQGSHFGIGLGAPLRTTILRRDRISVLVHVDPGIKIFTTSPALFGLAFPVGVTLGYAYSRELTVAFGVDMPLTLYVSPSPVNFVISPQFGPALEYRVDPRLTVGLNTRFGPVIYTQPGVSDFGFVMQVLAAYRM